MKRVGLGFRRDIADALIECPPAVQPAFIEVAPENWMNVGGHWGRKFREAAARYPVSAHGLSLSIGSPEELDYAFLREVKAFLDEVPIALYSEHLSYTKCDNAHLYDLLPVPFTEDAVRHIASRIQTVQEILERRIALENVSYYLPLVPEMSEAEFISAIVRESGCGLLLDVNNVYVNSFNHGYDAREFLGKLPLDQVLYIHMAGHLRVAEDLIIDTHGEAITDPVYELFGWTVERVPKVPVLLERDFNFDDLDGLFGEVATLERLTAEHSEERHAA
jgi:uncharacterized protein